jgi:RNA polymerase sigma-70 factor (ECF subfamily)
MTNTVAVLQSKGFFLNTQAALAKFLADVEKRAFKRAMYALRNEDLSLDAVQDAMLKLVATYAQRPPEEWGPLFQRILHSCIHDLLRRQAVRSRWVSVFSSLLAQDDPDGDFLEQFEVESSLQQVGTPAELYEQKHKMAIIEQEIARLPARQREAFLMRYWEGLNIAETALAMDCSEGSVKTHCSRATQALAAALRKRGFSDE